MLVIESVKVLSEFEAGNKPWYLQLNSLAPHHGGPVESDDPGKFETPAGSEWA